MSDWLILLIEFGSITVGYFFRLRSEDRNSPEETNFNILRLYKFKLGCDASGQKECIIQK